MAHLAHTATLSETPQSLHRQPPNLPEEPDFMKDRRSQWEDTAFFIGTLLLTAGGGLMIQAGLDLPLTYARVVWGAVGLVWGAVLIRVWLFRERGR